RFSSTRSRSTDHHFFFFHYTATPDIYTLSLHDALPISDRPVAEAAGRRRRRRVDLRVRLQPRLLHRRPVVALGADHRGGDPGAGDRKSTRLNSSHLVISYAVFCLKKKKKKDITLNMVIY